jgi:hypothetical protein
MRKSAWELAPWYRQNFTIFGAEDGDEGNGEGTGADGDDDDDDSDDGDDADDDANDGEADSSDSKTAALLKALREERTARKALEKKDKARERADARKKTEGDDALTATRTELEETRKKAEALASGFLKTSLNTAIKDAARDLKFRDVSDALALVSRDDIDFDQDEDNPDQVDIDQDTVKAALKKLAKAKPHLITSGTDDDDPTGSSGVGTRKNKKGNGDKTIEDWRAAYPAL